jgi:hypothetical protein
VEFDELFVGGKVPVIHGSTDRSSRGPSLQIRKMRNFSSVQIYFLEDQGRRIIRRKKIS